jgi:hypothetical protein
VVEQATTSDEVKDFLRPLFAFYGSMIMIRSPVGETNNESNEPGRDVHFIGVALELFSLFFWV